MFAPIRSLALTLAPLAPACDATRPVDLSVPWRFGTGDCESAGVDEVQVELFRDGARQPAVTGAGPCEAGALVLNEVPPGDYALVASGRDAAACTTHQTRLDALEVERGMSELPPVLLGLRPRPMEVRWTFDEAGTCSSRSVVQVEAIVRVGDAAPASAAWLCGAGAGRLPRVPAGPATITLLGLDATGSTVSRASVDLPESALLDAACEGDFRVELTLVGCASAGCP